MFFLYLFRYLQNIKSLKCQRGVTSVKKLNNLVDVIDSYNKILDLGCMFDRRIKRSIIISGDNNECNCFGNTEPTQQLFLSKHRSVQIKIKTSTTQLPHLSEQQIMAKSLNKRSLRKSNSPNNPLTSRTKTEEYYNCLQTPPLKKQLRSQQKQVNPFLRHYDQRPYFTQMKRFLQPPVAMNLNQRPPIWIPMNQQYSINPPPIAHSPPPRYIITHNQPPKINNFPTPVYYYTPQLSARSPPKVEFTNTKKMVLLNQIKQQVTIHINKQNRQGSKQSQSKRGQQQIIQFQLTEDNIDSPRLMPVYKKTPQQPFSSLRFSSKRQIKQEINDYNFGQAYKSKIVKPRQKTKVQKQAYPSKNQLAKVDPTWKSLTQETPRQKIGVKQKKSLKKMDDVDEIRSLGGSQKEEDDKQSVVVGRLRQYGSMLDPALSFTTPTLGSKLVSMNTQSSVGKSLLRSFEYSGERGHLK